MAKKKVLGKDLVVDIKKEQEEMSKKKFKDSIKYAIRNVDESERGLERSKKKLQELLGMSLEEFIEKRCGDRSSLYDFTRKR